MYKGQPPEQEIFDYQNKGQNRLLLTCVLVAVIYRQRTKS